MPWEIEYTDQFEGWWNVLDESERESVAAVVGLLEVKGPSLPHRYSSGVESSRHSHMRELRIQHKGEPYRVLYAFDPRRTAILPLGGCKAGDDRWYQGTFRSLTTSTMSICEL
jgi:hypothetical protein